MFSGIHSGDIRLYIGRYKCDFKLTKERVHIIPFLFGQRKIFVKVVEIEKVCTSFGALQQWIDFLEKTDVIKKEIHF